MLLTAKRRAQVLEQLEQLVLLCFTARPALKLEAAVVGAFGAVACAMWPIGSKTRLWNHFLHFSPLRLRFLRQNVAAKSSYPRSTDSNTYNNN